jgi:hypothetical protein
MGLIVCQEKPRANHGRYPARKLSGVGYMVRGTAVGSALTLPCECAVMIRSMDCTNSLKPAFSARCPGCAVQLLKSKTMRNMSENKPDLRMWGIEYVAVAVEALWVGGVGDEGIGAGKTADSRHIESRLVVQQPHRAVLPLPGKVPVGNRLVGRCAAVIAEGLH